MVSRIQPSALRHILETLGTQIAVLALGVVSGVIVARVLGPAGRGRYALLMMIPSLAFTFGNLGFGSAGTYYLNRGTIPRGRVVGSLYSVGVALALVSVTTILVLHPWRISIWQDIPRSQVVLAVLVTPFLFVLNFSSRILLGIGRIRQMNLLKLVQAACGVAAVVILVGLLRRGVTGAVIAFAASGVIGAAWGLTAGLSSVKGDRSPSRKFIVRGLGYGLPSFLILLANYLNHNFDVLLVKHYLDNSSVGLYTLVVAWVERLLYLPQSVGTVLFQRVASDESSGERQLVLRSGRHSVAVVAFGSIVLGVVAHVLIAGLYGSEYIGSVPALYSLLPGVVMLSLFQIYAVALAADGYPKIGAIGSAVSFGVNYGLDTIMIPRMGILGAGIATSVSYSLMAFIVLFAYKKRYGVTFGEMVFLRKTEAQESFRRLVAHVKTPGRGRK